MDTKYINQDGFKVLGKALKGGQMMRSTKREKLKFMVRVSSDTKEAVDLVNQSDVGISVHGYLRPSPHDCYIKEFCVYAVTGEKETIIGSCKGYFVNGKAMAQNGAFLEEVCDDLLPAETYFEAHDRDYMKEGISFIQISDVHVLPKYQGQGLGTWFLREAPDIAALYLGFSFDFVFVPFGPSLFESERKALNGNELREHRLLSERKKIVMKILNKLGYEVDLSGDTPVFLQKR
jgi:GNAT superfamily N-acetyltransferase